MCREVHAFEPLPALAAALRGNLPSNVTVHDSALSDRAGTAILKVPATKSAVCDGLSSIESKNNAAKLIGAADGLRIDDIDIKNRDSRQYQFA